MSDALETLQSMLAKAQAALEETEAYKTVAALEEAVSALKAANAPPVYVGVPPQPQDNTVQGLAIECAVKAGEPQQFRAVFDYIDAVKNYKDKTNAKANLSSILSKGKRLKPVDWKGGKAWWPAHLPLPAQSFGQTPP